MPSETEKVRITHYCREIQEILKRNEPPAWKDNTLFHQFIGKCSNDQRLFYFANVPGLWREYRAYRKKLALDFCAANGCTDLDLHPHHRLHDRCIANAQLAK